MKKQQKTKVGLIGTVGVPACYGGFETLAHQLVIGLKNEVDFTVYCSGKAYAKEERVSHWQGARLKYLPLGANGLSSILYDLLSILHAIRHTEVLLVLGVSAGIFLPVLKWLFRRPLIVNIDGLEWRRGKWNRFARAYLRFAERWAVAAADEVVADNAAIASYVQQTYGRDARMIPYGGDHVFSVTPTAEDKDSYPFLHADYAFKVCRIEPENNVEMILEAFSQQAAWPLVMVGNWERSEYGRALKQRFQAFSHLHLLDPIYELQTLNLLRANCSLYVHGHQAGGTNPSLVEAMSLGLPVFAHGVSYNRYTTEGQAKYFLAAKELKELLVQADPCHLEEMGIQMKNIAQRRYTWQAIASGYKHLICPTASQPAFAFPQLLQA